ncbi:MAG: GNAT family N-acetyltransferase [Acidimicrobiales bacterium]
MTAAPYEILRFGGERLRVGPWRGDHEVAYLAPLADAEPLSRAAASRCAETLRARGYRSVVTSALARSETNGLLEAGFSVHECLHLLAHDMVGLPAPPAPPDRMTVRRARRAERAAVLDVDHAAFSRFWQLDEHGLEEALTATPVSRFRVASSRGERPSRIFGYTVFGRAGPRGYLQRLAVHPSAAGRGLGRCLVLDGLSWLERRSVRQTLVNTQESNETALALYQRLGFVLQAEGLVVLRRALHPAAEP